MSSDSVDGAFNTTEDPPELFASDSLAATLTRLSLPLPSPATADDGIDGELEAINSLIRVSKTSEGRSSCHGILAVVLRRLPSSPQPLLIARLRLIRNLCAGDRQNQDYFIANSGADLVASAVLGPPLPPPDVIRAALQALANVVHTDEPHRAAVWARLFPAGFLDLARVRTTAVSDPLCMILYTCCAADDCGRRRLLELCERGMPILIEIISTASAVGFNEEWLEWLLCKICMEEPHLGAVFSSLGEGKSDTSFSKKQTFLLEVLSKFLNTKPDKVTVSVNFAYCVMKMLKEASTVVDFSCRGVDALPTDSPEIDVLGYSLVILRDVCAWEDPSTLEGIVNFLLSEGLLPLLLTFLRELEPPSVVRKSIARSGGMVGTKKVCPYRGFRRDVVSVIANCLYGRKQVQETIRELNGIPILLQQCVVDEDNPFTREWTVLAIRNLLEMNAENQKEISSLELQGPASTAEILELGLRVEIDKNTRQPRLVNNS